MKNHTLLGGGVLQRSARLRTNVQAKHSGSYRGKFEKNGRTKAKSTIIKVYVCVRPWGQIGGNSANEEAINDTAGYGALKADCDVM